MHERGFRWDLGDPVSNDIRLGVNTTKVVPNVVAEEESSLKVCQGASGWADSVTILEPVFALSVVTLKEKDGMRVGKVHPKIVYVKAATLHGDKLNVVSLVVELALLQNAVTF